jgi:hypothetical protein
MDISDWKGMVVSYQRFAHVLLAGVCCTSRITDFQGCNHLQYLSSKRAQHFVLICTMTLLNSQQGHVKFVRQLHVISSHVTMWPCLALALADHGLSTEPCNNGDEGLEDKLRRNPPQSSLPRQKFREEPLKLTERSSR